MRVKPVVGLAVGPVGSVHWGQVLVLPNAYGIIEIDHPEGRAQEIGVGILTELGKQLSRGVTSLQALGNIADSIRVSSVRTLALLVPVGQVVYVVVRGSGMVYVLRGGELASLMHEDGGVSGEVHDGDIFLLASHGFTTVLTRRELSEIFDHLPPPDIAEKLTLLLHEKKGGEGSVALVFGASVLPSEENTEETPQEEEDRQEITQPPIATRIRFVLSRFGEIRRRPPKMTALLAAGLSTLFVLSVIIGISKQGWTQKNQQLAIAANDAQHAFDEGVALLELNPVKGRERLQSAKAMLDPFMTGNVPRSQEGRRVVALYRQITDNLTAAMQVVESNPALFYDVTLLKKNAVADGIARDGDVLVISDRSTGTVYKIMLSSKKADIAGGGQVLTGLSLITIHGNTIYALTDEGIVRLGSDNQKPVLVVKKDDAWGTIRTLAAFGGNLYLLDTAKGRIWKYVATEKGFSEMREYLNPDTLPDLSQATGMSIDGSVWIGTGDGRIQRFTQGKENTFVPRGVEPPLGTRLAVYTSDATTNVYVLDSQNNRVVVLDKEGVYIAQYTFTSATAPDTFVVSETDKKILLLISGKIYNVDLK